MIEQRGLGRKLRSVRLVLLACVAALCLVPGASVGQEGGGYQNLEPGRRADLHERVPVNFVFVGYERDDVDLGGFIGGLPEEYKPVVRSEYLQTKPFQKDSATRTGCSGICRGSPSPRRSAISRSFTTAMMKSSAMIPQT